jgi:hypothetical protein
MKFYLYIFLFLFYAINIANAGTIDPSVKDSKYIEYGSKFDYVGQLCGIYDNGIFFCASAVVIKENIVLTAAHVVKNQKTCYIKIKDKNYDIVKVVSHKDFTTKMADGGDIAVCFVKEPIKLDFYPELYSDSDELNKECSIAGHGLTGTFITGAHKSDSKKRAGSNVIDNIYNDHLLVCSVSRSDKRKTGLEFLIGSGDSGGGLFIGNKLAGINSCVLADDKKPDSSYSDESGHTRISKYREWIIDNSK